MPLRPARAARRGVIGAPVARTAAVVGTAAVVTHGVRRREDRRERPPRRPPGPSRPSLTESTGRRRHPACGVSHLYWRQLRDMKGPARVEMMTPVTIGLSPASTAGPLARSQARSVVVLAAYLGQGDKFDRSITDFSIRYATRTRVSGVRQAIRSGRFDAVEGV